MSLFDVVKQRIKISVTNSNNFNQDAKLIKSYKNYDKRLLIDHGKCREFDKHIKLLVFADTHGHLVYDSEFIEKQITDYDVCLLLGDITCDDIRVILKVVNKDKIYGILGNHDNFDNLEKCGIPNIAGEIITINGVNILGIEGSLRYTDRRPGFTLEEGDEYVKTLPYCDILISHSPPFGALGYEQNSVHIGAPYINRYIFEKHIPIILSGHNHVDSEYKMLNGTMGYSVYNQKLLTF